MKKTLAILFLFLSVLANAQIVENYKIKIGLGIANQEWNYANEQFSELNGKKDEKLGFNVHFGTEFKIVKHFSIFTEIGFIQKGFSDELVLNLSQNQQQNIEELNVTLNNISINCGLKINTHKTFAKPYFLLGLHSDYQIAYKESGIEIENIEYSLYKTILEDSKKLNFGVQLGVGFSFNEKIYLDFEMIPSISKSFNDSSLSIIDKFYSISLGLNLNRLKRNSSFD